MKHYNLFTLLYWALAAYVGLRSTSGASLPVKLLAVVVAVLVFFVLVDALRRRRRGAHAGESATR